MHWLSTFEAYKDWCSQQHPEMDSTKCASVYQLMKTKDEFDTFQGSPYVSYIDGKLTEEPVKKLRKYSPYPLHFGLLLHLLKIKIDEKLMLALMIIANMAF